MWNREKIALRLKIINDRIKSGVVCDKNLLISRDLYYRLLENSSNFGEACFSYVLHKLKLYDFTNSGKSHCDFNDVVSDFIKLPNDELLNLLSMLYEKVVFDYGKYNKFNLKYDKIYISDAEKRDIIVCFFQDLNFIFGDLVECFFTEKNYFNYSYFLSYENRFCNGKTFYDLDRYDVYVAIKKTNDILELQALEHELVHVVDFMLNSKSIKNHCPLYYDIIPFTVDLIFIDYLIDNKIYYKEANKLLAQKIVNICNVDFSNNMEYKFRLLCFYLADYLYKCYKDEKNVDKLIFFMKNRILTNDILNYFDGDNPFFDKQKVLSSMPYKDYYFKWRKNNEQN